MDDNEPLSKQHNLAALAAELDWLEAVIAHVFARYFKDVRHEGHWWEIAMPSHDTGTVYGQYIAAWEPDPCERVALALAMAPHLRPESLDLFFGINANTQRAFTQFGGRSDSHFGGFLPTGQTLMFLLAANDPSLRGTALRILSPQHRFGAEQVFGAGEGSGSPLAKVLTLSEQWLRYFIDGETLRPEWASDFPASPMTTPLEWADLVLEPSVMAQVGELQAWLKHDTTLMRDWGLARKMKPGFRALFKGPHGTGKHLTAALLAKATGRFVYRVDLAPQFDVVKYLARNVAVTERQHWILFFDEADALFGQRTEVEDANARYTHQQISYLLQRLEDFSGLVIVASHSSSLSDEAFTRRFHSVVHFPVPNAEQRLRLWKNAFEGVCAFESDIDLVSIAEEYELTGGAIINVLRRCALTAIGNEHRTVGRTNLLAAIRREIDKEGRSDAVLS